MGHRPAPSSRKHAVSIAPAPSTARALQAVQRPDPGDRAAVDGGGCGAGQPGGGSGGAPPAQEALRILVCEDDELVRLALAELLMALDCRVVEAASASQARALLASQRVDLLLTDLGLPDGDGLTLAGWARRQQPGLAVVIASGSDCGDALAALPGALALRKPFDLDDLCRLLAGVSARRSPA